MTDLETTRATQLTNIAKKSGKSLDDLARIVRASGLAKHGELREMLKSEHGLGHGDANLVISVVQARAERGSVSLDESVGGYYSGAKAALLPIHQRVMAELAQLGHFEIAPKKTYLSLRRRKQFATVGPATNGRVDVGLNLKGVEGAGRLEALPPGGMCTHRVKLTVPSDVDETLLGWLAQAFAQAE